MKLALHLYYLAWPGGPSALAPTLTAMARAADQGGFSTLTMMDHYFQMEDQGGPSEPMLEGYTALGYLAGQTTNIELGLLVGGVTYRQRTMFAPTNPLDDIDAFLTTMQAYATLGISKAWTAPPNDTQDPVQWVNDVCDKVIPRLNSL